MREDMAKQEPALTHPDPHLGIPRGNVSLERDGKVYWFATDQEAERGARLLDQAAAVQTIQDGSSPAALPAVLVAQTINEAQENGDLRVDDNRIVATETNEVVTQQPTLIASALAARSALETERQNILADAKTPHEVSLDGALRSYVNGRTDAYNNIRNALVETSVVELPKAIEAHELAVVAPLAIEREQSLSFSMV